jgi:hypothetical protein
MFVLLFVGLGLGVVRNCSSFYLCLSMLISTNRFDILLADYSRSPKIYIKMPYPIMINLNLHLDGKVCLSLLGT